MQPWNDLIFIERKAANSIFSQVSKGVVDVIQRGVLKPGDQLPSVRKMAKILCVHPKTVVAAYEDLETQGWITTIPRKGVYVSNVLPIIKPVAFAARKNNAYAEDMTIGNTFEGGAKKTAKRYKKPEIIIDDGFPDHRLASLDVLLRDYRSLMKRGYAIRAATFGEYPGAEELRIALSKFLRETRALAIDEQNLCITRGAQMGLYLVCRTLVKKGMKVVVAEPNYPIANDVLKECGAQLIRVPVQSDGLDVEAIKQICSEKKIDGIYVIPHHHHPTTVTLSPEKRIAILEIVEKYGLFVIEDDYDYDFHYDSSPVLPLASYVKGQNIYYLGSLSKTISNSLRIGFVCATKPAIKELIRLRRLVDLRGDTFFELALANFVSSGEFTKHLKRTNKIYAGRRDLMFKLLQNELADYLKLTKPKGGMAFWTTFDPSIDLQAVSDKALQRGLYMSNGTFYNTSATNLNSLRMGFASKNEQELYATIEILKAVLKNRA